jgi:hypothetical protein
LLDGIVDDIRKMLKRIKPENAYRFEQVSLKFDDNKIYDSVPEEERDSNHFNWAEFEENYHLKGKSICETLCKAIDKSSHGKIKAGYEDMFESNFRLTIFFLIKYELSKELVKKLLVVSKG